MFGDWFEPEEPNPLDEQIAAVLAEMKRITPTGDDYDTLVRKLERLSDVKTNDRPKRLSRDALFTGFVQLAGIVLIVLAERQSVLSQKAMGFVPRTFK